MHELLALVHGGWRASAERRRQATRCLGEPPLAVQAQRGPPSPHPAGAVPVRDWWQYDAKLKRRGNLTLWLDEAAMACWQAPRRITPGGQAGYSYLAIELVLMPRLVFQLALRQARGSAGHRPSVAPHGPMHWPGPPILAQAALCCRCRHRRDRRERVDGERRQRWRAGR